MEADSEAADSDKGLCFSAKYVKFIVLSELSILLLHLK